MFMVPGRLKRAASNWCCEMLPGRSRLNACCPASGAPAALGVVDWPRHQWCLPTLAQVWRGVLCRCRRNAGGARRHVVVAALTMMKTSFVGAAKRFERSSPSIRHVLSCITDAVTGKAGNLVLPVMRIVVFIGVMKRYSAQECIGYSVAPSPLPEKCGRANNTTVGLKSLTYIIQSARNIGLQDRGNTLRLRIRFCISTPAFSQDATSRTQQK